MGTSLLIGNGPNRISDSTVSWDKVLKQIASDNQTTKGPISTDKPLPLLFEELALRLDQQGSDGLGDMKRRFALAVREMSPNLVHRKIMSRGYRHVLTTNYDYSFELAADDTLPERADSKLAINETKYSLFRYRAAGPTRVWHIHGEVGYPNTLQLGYEHDGSGLARIRAYVNKGVRGHSSAFIKGNKDFDNGSSPYSWVDVFLRDDIHILGLGLDFVELDLWWLLVYKERMRCTRSCAVGKTIYYWTEMSERPPATLTLHSMLEGLGVRVVYVKGDGEADYAGAYLQAIEKMDPLYHAST